MASEDEELREVRRERHLRRLRSRHPRCQHCGEDAPAALLARGGEVVCYACAATRAGRSTVEQHHIAGRHNDPMTVPLPANVHRLVSDEQRGWPDDTLRNPGESPLRWAAAWIRGSLDLARVLCGRAVKVAIVLERLDDGLRARFGARWWDQLDFDDDPARASDS